MTSEATNLRIRGDLLDCYMFHAGEAGRDSKRIVGLIESISMQDAKLATLAKELFDANMAWATKCEENAALKAELAAMNADNIRLQCARVSDSEIIGRHLCEITALTAERDALVECVKQLSAQVEAWASLRRGDHDREPAERRK